MNSTTIWTSAIILTVAAIIGGSVMSKKIRGDNPFADRHILEKGLLRPTLWIFYDSSEVNSRSWADFGARSSHALNLPYLNLAYETIIKHNGRDFNVTVLMGIESVAEHLGGWDALPEPLRRPALTLSAHQRAWIRAAILKKYGGLWLDPSVIALGSFSKVADSTKPVFFGTDQTLLQCTESRIPDFCVAWSPKAEHPIFARMEAATRRILMEGGGGSDARQDDKWIFQEATKDTDYIILSMTEVARNKGRKLEVEDFLAAGQGGELHFAIPSTALYVPFPLDEVRRRRMFGWFLRMSEDQILGSDLVVSQLLKLSLNN